MGRALLVTEPGSANPRAALEADGWRVDVCRPADADRAFGDDIALVACQLAYPDGQPGPTLLARLIAEHPNAGGFLFGTELDEAIEPTLLEAPDTPVIRVPAPQALVRLAVDSALTAPR